MKTLMYSGFSGKMYAHFMPWFGGSNHMSVGYASNDATQVSKQVTDMISRGFDGAIVDWYGPDNNRTNQTTLMLRDEIAKRNGTFEFAVMEDAGALNACVNTAGCDVTQKLINDLTYANQNYFGAAGYIKVNGRPIVALFGEESITSIDWARVASSAPGNPAFIWRNAGGFTKPFSSGSFSWVSVNTSNPDDWGQGYLDYYYKIALLNPTETSFATGYKGFDDTLAAWTANRITNQNCGQTWLNSISESAKYYNASTQTWVQVATWNDYEEGTEIETGIDNCVSISASVSGTTLSWSINGQQNTIDHYTIFASLDGENLAVLTDVATGTNSLDLKAFSLAPATYQLYVKAVGKPSIVNHLSAAASFNVANIAPVAQLTVTPGTGIAPVSVTADASGSSDSDGSVAKTTIDFGDGTVASGATASHTYSSAGNYTITASVTDDLGATSTAKQTITVVANQPPVAKLAVSPASGIAPVAVSASTSGSTDSDGSIASTVINWGDGTSTAAASGSHTYSTPGTYTVTATVTDDRNATSSATATVTVAANQPPVAKLSVTPSSGTAPVAVSASTSGSSDADGTITSTVINWGDGTSTSAASGSHTYSSAGTFTVTATVTDDRGASSSATATVIVSAPAPAVSPSYGVTVQQPTNNSTVGSPVRVVATAASSAPITSMRIYVDNASVYVTSAAKIDTYVTMTPGSHYVVVQAWDGNGKIYKTPLTITVK